MNARETLKVNNKGHLELGGADCVELAKQFGTPLYLFDEAYIRRMMRIYRDTIIEKYNGNGIVLYASKAFSCQAIYRIADEENIGIDVVSGGELYTALKANFPAEKIVMHGNNKLDYEIGEALDAGIGYIVADAYSEIDKIDAEAKKRNIKQRILLRINPGVEAHTHAFVQTATTDSKFGFSISNGTAEEATAYAMNKQNVELMGYHCHVGSQLFDEELFCDSANAMLTFTANMAKDHGFMAKVLNLGGGMGVPYTADEPAVDYAANIRAIGQCITDLCNRLNIAPPAILMEPGRSIVADAGITLYTVTGTKEIPGFKNYVNIDGGMTDNPRYTLYQSPYTVYNAGRMHERADFSCTVAGRCCESGDLIQENVNVARPVRGDTLAVLTTGAYNYSMASNYNRIPRPAVVMIAEGEPYTAVRRETFKDLISCDG